MKVNPSTARAVGVSAAASYLARNPAMSGCNSMASVVMSSTFPTMIWWRGSLTLGAPPLYHEAIISRQEVLGMVRRLTHLADGQYAKLLSFRTGLRRFLRWSEEQAATVGLTSAQHQLLLAIRGHQDSRGPSVGELADYLCTRHHSAVQLIDRTEQLGLITRGRGDSEDRRVVRLALTR